MIYFSFSGVFVGKKKKIFHEKNNRDVQEDNREESDRIQMWPERMPEHSDGMQCNFVHKTWDDLHRVSKSAKGNKENQKEEGRCQGDLCANLWQRDGQRLIDIGERSSCWNVLYRQTNEYLFQSFNEYHK